MCTLFATPRISHCPSFSLELMIETSESGVCPQSPQTLQRSVSTCQYKYAYCMLVLRTRTCIVHVWFILCIKCAFLFQLLCELRGQSGLINCLVWSAKEKTLFAGDSQGGVCLWKERQEGWYLYKKIDAMKVTNVLCLNNILCVPN